MKELSVKFDLSDSEFYTALRLVAGAFCSIGEKDVDCAEDFKVCVTESALILKNCGFKSVNAVFSAQDGVKAVLTGEGGNPMRRGKRTFACAYRRAGGKVRHRKVRRCDKFGNA